MSPEVLIGVVPCLLPKGGPSLGIPYELVRHAESRAPPPAYEIRICNLTRLPGDFQVQKSLRRTGLGPWYHLLKPCRGTWSTVAQLMRRAQSFLTSYPSRNSIFSALSLTFPKHSTGSPLPFQGFVCFTVNVPFLSCPVFIQLDF